MRDQSVGSGGGRVASLLTDGGGPVPTGRYPSLVAQTNAGSRAVEVSVVLAPA